MTVRLREFLRTNEVIRERRRADAEEADLGGCLGIRVVLSTNLRFDSLIQTEADRLLLQASEISKARPTEREEVFVAHCFLRRPRKSNRRCDRVANAREWT